MLVELLLGVAGATAGLLVLRCGLPSHRGGYAPRHASPIKNGRPPAGGGSSS